METIEIVYWLRDKAARATSLSHTRMLNLAADRLKELDQQRETAHWIIHTSKDDIWAECSNCLTCGSPKWKVCPVCERKMVNINERKADRDDL